MAGKKRCPVCDSTDNVRIIYGLPGPELAKKADRGEVALGGCCFGPESPTRYCRACRHSW